MIFASLIFLYIFLPLNLILYFTVRRKNVAVRNVILILFSLVFYAWGEPIFIFLMILTALFDWNNARLIEKYRGSVKAKIIYFISLTVDIGILILFKYSAFLIENINMIPIINIPIPTLALPIGISFYTFQTISYVSDVYKGKMPAQPKFYKYLMYLSMYPQLVAGPIVRYDDIVMEIDNRSITVEKMRYGFERFIIGLSKKVLIANVAGEFVSKYMLVGSTDNLSVLGAWFGSIMYTLQIYFDFSGYSDMAIGLGSLFGFKFPENFNYPYISKSISEFWRRWHITLGRFFRDYVYIPLGGNRNHVLRNLFVVWFLTGFWHGASWNFIAWGLYNGFFIFLERRFKNIFEKIPLFIRHIYLLLIVNTGFVLFYFHNIKDALSHLKIMFGAIKRPLSGIEMNVTIVNNIFWIIIAIIACFPIIPKIKKHTEKIQNNKIIIGFESIKLVFLIILLFLSTASLVGDSYNPFLYFQF